ncbi:MAG: DUF4403 family protein, partial [Bacteroidia bacterium]|nr:DUF4403 family protein [Bacteroidia bacterium]
YMSSSELLTRGNVSTNLETAVVYLPIEGKMEDIEQFIRSNFGKFQFGDITKEEDDLIVSATVHDDIRINIEKDSLLYVVPLDLDIIKRTFLGDVRAHGMLLLSMKTYYDIDMYWNLTTHTEVIRYQWLKTPRANMSVISMSIEALANRLIENNKEELTTTIDNSIAENVNLRKSLSDIWYLFKDPFVLSEEYQVWLQMKPISMGVSRFMRDEGEVKALLKVEINPKVRVGPKPVSLQLDSLPEFDWLGTDTSGYIIPVRLSIPEDQLTALINQYLQDETFEFGNRQVTISNLKLIRDEEKLMVSMDAAGDVDGHINIEGIPIYNRKKERVEFLDFDYDVKSSNLMLKSTALLFKQQVEKRILSNLNKLIEDQRLELLQIIEERLVATNKNQWLNVENTTDHLSIVDLGMDKDGMWVYVLAKGQASARFKYQTKASE